jgi:hypothetical protein
VQTRLLFCHCRWIKFYSWDHVVYSVWFRCLFRASSPLGLGRVECALALNYADGLLPTQTPKQFLGDNCFIGGELGVPLVTLHKLAPQFGVFRRKGLLGVGLVGLRFHGFLFALGRFAAPVLLAWSAFSAA